MFRGSWDPLKREEPADYCAGTTKPDYYANTAPGQGLTEGSNKLGPKVKMDQDQFWDQNQDVCIDSLETQDHCQGQYQGLLTSIDQLGRY